MPAVTVIMPVYNGERYLREAIDSVLSQTFRDFEFLILNDGSTDTSAHLIASYEDPRIRALTNEVNCGLVFTLNRGIDQAIGKYIARMDADDIALPTRLESQVRFLEGNANVGLVGSWYETFGSKTEIAQPYMDHERIAVALLFNSAFGHPTVMYRTETLRLSKARYAADQFPIEDWEMWVRMVSLTRVANLPSVLLRYRVHTTSVTGTQGANLGSESPTIKVAKTLYIRLLTRLGIEPTAEELNTHTRIGYGFPFEDANAIHCAESWLRRLIAANRRARVYSEPAFSEVVGSRWSAVNFGRNGSLLEKSLGWMKSPLFRHAIRGAITNRVSRFW